MVRDTMPQPNKRLPSASDIAYEIIWRDARTFYMRVVVVCTALGIAAGAGGMYLWLS